MRDEPIDVAAVMGGRVVAAQAKSGLAATATPGDGTVRVMAS
jgi:hypothetical protein